MTLPVPLCCSMAPEGDLQRQSPATTTTSGAPLVWSTTTTPSFSPRHCSEMHWPAVRARASQLPTLSSISAWLRATRLGCGPYGLVFLYEMGQYCSLHSSDCSPEMGASNGTVT